jgi:hypothetical protein
MQFILFVPLYLHHSKLDQVSEHGISYVKTSVSCDKSLKVSGKYCPVIERQLIC